MEKGNGAKNGMNELIGNTLRIGVFAACIIALVGGIYYLATTSGHPVPDYTTFHKGAVSYTTFEGIVRGAFSLSATEWMQLGVVVLMLTPIMRVVFVSRFLHSARLALCGHYSYSLGCDYCQFVSGRGVKALLLCGNLIEIVRQYGIY